MHVYLIIAYRSLLDILEILKNIFKCFDMLLFRVFYFDCALNKDSTDSIVEKV